MTAVTLPRAAQHQYTRSGRRHANGTVAHQDVLQDVGAATVSPGRHWTLTAHFPHSHHSLTARASLTAPHCLTLLTTSLLQ